MDEFATLLNQTWVFHCGCRLIFFLVGEEWLVDDDCYVCNKHFEEMEDE